MTEREVDDRLLVSVLGCEVIVFPERGQAHVFIREDAQGLCATAFLLGPHQGKQLAKKRQDTKGRWPHPTTAAPLPPTLGETARQRLKPES